MVKPSKRGKLPAHKREAYVMDVEAGMSDVDLAKKYKLSERTATNWRVNLCGKRTA